MHRGICRLLKVDDLSKEMVTSVACGAFHSLAVTSSGRLFEWGLIHTHPASSINVRNELSRMESLHWGVEKLER